jgi:PKD repeat protein
MKIPLLAALLFLCCLYTVQAQRCGTAIANIPSDTTVTRMFTPPSVLLPCIDSGSYVSDTIYFKNDYYRISSMPFTISYARIDSIANLPAGLCWQTNTPNDSFLYHQYGAILISGYCTAAPGRYQLRMIVDMGLTPFNIVQHNMDAYPTFENYVLQVKDSTAACPPIDTTWQWYMVPMSISPVDTTVCGGQPVTLTASAAPGFHYQWSTGDTTQSITVTGGGYYSVSAYQYPFMGQSANSGVVNSEIMQPHYVIDSDTGAAQHWIVRETSPYSSINQYTLKYDWNWGDSTTSTGRDATHTYSTAGTYYLCLTLSDTIYGCSETYCDSTPRLMAGDSVTSSPRPFLIMGITEPNAPQIRAYPNPASTTLTIERADGAPATALIYDAMGRMVQQYSLSGTSSVIDVSALSEGIYNIAIQHISASAAMRLVVLRR